MLCALRPARADTGAESLKRVPAAALCRLWPGLMFGARLRARKLLKTGRVKAGGSHTNSTTAREAGGGSCSRGANPAQTGNMATERGR